MGPAATPFGEAGAGDTEGLYADVLYSQLHMVGSDAPTLTQQWAQIEHLRKAFRVHPSRHIQHFERASARPKPQMNLNLSVIEANLRLSSGLDTNATYLVFVFTSRQHQGHKEMEWGVLLGLSGLIGLLF